LNFITTYGKFLEEVARTIAFCLKLELFPSVEKLNNGFVDFLLKLSSLDWLH